jgi:TPR repeat protein
MPDLAREQKNKMSAGWNESARAWIAIPDRKDSMKPKHLVGVFVAIVIALGWHESAWSSPLEDGFAAIGRKDYVRALDILLPLAKAGVAPAQNSVAILYSDGPFGITKDPQEAARWFRLAAEQGYPESEYAIGVLYRNGGVVPKNGLEAVKWFTRAANNGYLPAAFNLGSMYKRGDDVPQNLLEARKWYQKAAEAGFAPAQTSLGVMYARNEGGPHSFDEAAKWFRRAAEQGDANGQYNLGRFYLIGEAVGVDLVLAHKWLSLAAAQGVEQALTMRDVARKKLNPLQLARSQLLISTFRPVAEITSKQR